MRIKQILVAFLFTALVISCGNKAKDTTETAKDINVSEIKTECEAVDALLIAMDEIVALGEAVDSEEEASEAQKKEYKFLVEKSEEIGAQTDRLDFKKSDLKDCPSFETLEKNMRKIKKNQIIKLHSEELMKTVSL